MRSVFGLPAGVLAAVLTLLVVGAAALIVGLAMRNRVFLRMGVRNVPRRPARSALIVVGLMLGTAIISSALLTGDTMASAVRGSVLTRLGHADIAVTAGAQAPAVEGLAGIPIAQPYFDVAPALGAVDTVAEELPVDGVMAAIVEPVAARNPDSLDTEPRLTLFAPDPDRLAPFELERVSAVQPGEALLNTTAASSLSLAEGDRVEVLAGDQVTTLVVAEVGSYRGVGTDGAALIMPLPEAQAFLLRSGEVNSILVSNEGGLTGGIDHDTTVLAPLEEVVAPLGLTAEPVKADGLEAADVAGDAFVELFTTFGSFSMAAGILLIFLIFVMLATERRSEMGMARAVGIQRRHLVESFLFEGALYDVVAAAVGAALGVAVSFVMVEIVGSVFATEGLDLTYSLSARSLVIGYSIGALLTLGVITASAWRVSRLNIVSAIRDLTEPPARGRSRSAWVTLGILVPLGLALAISGAAGNAFVPWMLGVSFLLLALIPILRMAGAPERIAFTLTGCLLVVLWLLPLDFFDRFFGRMTMDFTVWVVGGLLIVIATTWVVTYNADLLMSGLYWATSPFARLRPVVKMAVAYPLASRFRTGVTMAMFMLVVFTLVTGTIIPTAFTRAFDDVERFGGGFDLRVSVVPGTAGADLDEGLPADLAAAIETDGSQSLVPVLASQDGSGRPESSYPLRGLDDDFLAATGYELVATARGYTSADVWEAMRTDPTLAVVDSFVAPRRQNWNVAALPDFQLSGFYVEDRTFAPVPVTAVDPLSGTTIPLTVVGVLSDSAPWGMAGISVSQDALAPLGGRAVPTVHHLTVADGQDAQVVATAVQSELLAQGAVAETYQEVLDDLVASNLLFLRLIQGFMGLGLLVGVAALAVVSARAVVERRQQLGVLRAIGFQPTMIRLALLTESSVVTLLSIGAGAVLGMVLSFNVLTDARNQPGWSEVTFEVPWLNLGIVFAVVFAAAQLTTLLPARRASRVYPAEALRYQ